VLIESGEVDEGMSLVQRALNENEEPYFKAFNLAILAMGHLRRHESTAAGRLLALAERMDGHCQLLKHVRQRMAADTD